MNGPFGTLRQRVSEARKSDGLFFCWFTRSANVWGASCKSEDWAKGFAGGVLRPGAFAHGTKDFIYRGKSWYESLRHKIGEDGKCHYNLNSFLGDPGWTAFEGGSGALSSPGGGKEKKK